MTRNSLPKILVMKPPAVSSCSVVLAAVHPAVNTNDVEQDDQVEDSDEDEESPRDHAGDEASDYSELSPIAGDALDDPFDGEAQRARDEKDNSRMAEREEESDSDRLTAVLEKLACRVVDRGDVIGVESVPQPKRVRQPTEGQDRRVAGAV